MELPAAGLAGKHGKSRSEPLMHRWICSASAGQPHHTQRLNQAWPCLPAPAQTSKDRAEGIFSQKEYQDLIFLGRGEKPIKPKAAPCAWKSRDSREQLMEPHPCGAGEQQEGDPAGQGSAGKLSLAQAEPSLTPQMWSNSSISTLGLFFFECYKLCCK